MIPHKSERFCRHNALILAYLNVQKRAILTITPSSKRRTISEEMATDTNKTPEPPLPHPEATPDAERAQKPPLPAPPYRPYAKTPAAPEPPYKPYAKKSEPPEPPYEPYKGM
jgi:hypothetical protein